MNQDDFSSFAREIDSIHAMVDSNYLKRRSKKNQRTLFNRIKHQLMKIDRRQSIIKSAIYLIGSFVFLSLSINMDLLRWKIFFGITFLVLLLWSLIYLLLWEIKWMLDDLKNSETFEKHLQLIINDLKNTYMKEILELNSLLYKKSKISRQKMRTLCLDLLISSLEDSIEIVKNRLAFLEKSSIIFSLPFVLVIYMVMGWPKVSLENPIDFLKYIPYLIFVATAIQPLLFMSGQTRIEDYRISLLFLHNLIRIEDASHDESM